MTRLKEKGAANKQVEVRQMKFKELWPDMKHGEKRKYKDGEILKGNSGSCAVCNEKTEFWDDLERANCCGEKCEDLMTLHTVMLMVGACGKLEAMEAEAVYKIFAAWSPEQIQEASDFWIEVHNHSIASEFGEEYRAVICPEHLKEYGCCSLAAIKAWE